MFRPMFKGDALVLLVDATMTAARVDLAEALRRVAADLASLRQSFDIDDRQISERRRGAFHATAASVGAPGPKTWSAGIVWPLTAALVRTGQADNVEAAARRVLEQLDEGEGRAPVEVDGLRVCVDRWTLAIEG